MSSWLRTLAGMALLVAAPAALGQVPKDVNAAILEELRQIRALLEQMQRNAPQPAPPPARAAQEEGPIKLGLKGAYILGRLDAPVTMVEFSDYECPFCRQFHTASFEDLKKKYIDTGQVRYVSRDFPLEFHPNAKAAAKAARCAGEQGRFWEMRKGLIVNGNALGPDTAASVGRDLKLDESALRACIASDRFDKVIQAEMDEAKSLGVSGTPTFVLGRSSGDSVEGVRIVGAQPFATFELRIRSLLTQ